MLKAAKTRIFLLLLAAFTTLLALTPPKTAQACFAYDVETCYYANGTTCQLSDCSKYNNCNGSQVSCYYQRTVCCV
ncbi:MAG TPA: hypothetical protein VGP73_01085 [Thermoanaerobaculia bacterium]